MVCRSSLELAWLAAMQGRLIGLKKWKKAGFSIRNHKPRLEVIPFRKNVQVAFELAWLAAR